MTLNQIVSNMLATRIGQMPEPRNFPADTRNLATIMTNMRHHEILGQADPSHRRQLEGLIGTKNYDELMLRCDRDLQAIDSVTLRRMQKEGAAAGSLQSR